MPDRSNNKPAMPPPAARARTFLKGVIYFNNRGTSIDCTIRDLSDTGAKIEFASLVTVPDLIELHIPQKQRTFPARVMRRESYEIGVSFEDQRSGDPPRALDVSFLTRLLRCPATKQPRFRGRSLSANLGVLARNSRRAKGGLNCLKRDKATQYNI